MLYLRGSVFYLLAYKCYIWEGRYFTFLPINVIFEGVGILPSCLWMLYLRGSVFYLLAYKCYIWGGSVFYSHVKTQKTQKAKKTEHELLTVPDLSRVCVGQFLVICEMFVDQCLFSCPFSFDVTCVVWFSIYTFWYLQLFLTMKHSHSYH